MPCEVTESYIITVWILLNCGNSQDLFDIKKKEMLV